MIKKIAYFNPVIRVAAYSDDGRKFTSYAMSGDGEMCRENVLRYLWYCMKIVEQKNEAPYTMKGDAGIIINLEVGIPSEKAPTTHGKWNSWGAPPNSVFVKRIRDLRTSSLERLKLLSMLDVLTAVPALLAVGPKAWAGNIMPGAMSFSEADHGYDQDIPTDHTDISLVNLTNLVMAHPVLLSIILSLGRWGIEEYSRGRFMAFDNLIHGVSRTRSVLNGIRNRGVISEQDRNYLLELYAKFIRFSDSLLVNRKIERYPLNKIFAKNVLDFLKSMNQYDGTETHKVWKGTIGTGIYGATTGYGFYKWLRESFPTQNEKQLAVLDSQGTYSPEHKAYVING